MEGNLEFYLNIRNNQSFSARCADNARKVVSSTLGNSRWFLNYSNSSPIISLCRDDGKPKNIDIRFYIFGSDVSIIDDHVFSGNSSKAVLRRSNQVSYSYNAYPDYFGFPGVDYNNSQDCLSSSSNTFTCRLSNNEVSQFSSLESNPKVRKASNRLKIPRQFFRKSKWSIKTKIMFPTDFEHRVLSVVFQNNQISFKFETKITGQVFIGGYFSIVKENPKNFLAVCKVGDSKIDVCELSVPSQEQEFYFSYELFLFKQFTTEIFSSAYNLIDLNNPMSSQSKPTVSLLESLSRDIATVYTEGAFSDVKVKVDEKVFNAHQAILCARSPVFKAMLEANMAERNSKVINISDLDSQSVEIMLKYVYSGEANLDVVSAKKLYYAGDKYQMTDLKEACSVLLKSNITMKNVFEVLIMADNHNDEDLMTAVQNFICMQKGKMFHTDVWDQFLTENPLLAAKTMQLYLKRQESEINTEHGSKLLAFPEH